MRRLRSVLYTPGHRPDRIRKALATAADSVGLVLEDSVPHDERAAARVTVAASIAEFGPAGRTILVKVNALGRDGLEADLAHVVVGGLTGLIVPKLTSAEEVRTVDRLVTAAEARAGLAEGSIALLLMIETPRAVVNAHELAAASARVASVICAAAIDGDLAGALGMQTTPGGLERLYLLSKVLVDARAAGVETPLDGVWTRIGDLAGLEREARRARSLGYRGKLAIHPEQIEPINRIFTPTSEEVAHSRRVIDAFAAALERKEAAIVVDEVMIDYAMVETARRVLELAGELPEAGA
jgi:citrate lyase subunit beta/citryl-CoA lyase